MNGDPWTNVSLSPVTARTVGSLSLFATFASNSLRYLVDTVDSYLCYFQTYQVCYICVSQVHTHRFCCWVVIVIRAVLSKMAGADTDTEAGVEKTHANHGDASSLPELNNDQIFPSYVAASAAVPVPISIPDPPGDIRNRPSSRHRGLFNHLVVVKTIEEPVAYSRKLKWMITFLAAGAAAIDPISSTIFYRTHLVVDILNPSLTVGF